MYAITKEDFEKVLFSNDKIVVENTKIGATHHTTTLIVNGVKTVIRVVTVAGTKYFADVVF